MTTLRSGTFTFLLADVEANTRLWEQQPEAMQHATIRHDILIEQHVAHNRGVVVRPRGERDRRFAAYERPLLAVTAQRRTLPTEATPLIGRDTELQALQGLRLRPDVRLIAIVGVGGVGKTRLAVAVASQVLLSPDEQVPIPRLNVFAGGFTTEAILRTVAQPSRI